MSVAGHGPEDVAPDLHVAGAAVHGEGVAGGLVDGVVGEQDAADEVDAHAERGVGVDQVVGEEGAAEDVVDAAGLDADRVVVDLVAHDVAGAADD